MTTWRLLGLSTLLSATLATVPVAAADSDGPGAKDDLAKIQKQLERIQTSLDQMKEIREDLNFTNKVKIPSLEREMRDQIRDLKAQMVNMADEIEKLKSPGGTSRTAYYAGPSGPTGSIRLRNAYVTSVTFLINDRLYEVPSGGELTLKNQPTGEFTYEVINVQPPIRRMLAANKTFEIQVYPR
jgi:hypothetical protein